MMDIMVETLYVARMMADVGGIVWTSRDKATTIVRRVATKIGVDAQELWEFTQSLARAQAKMRS